MLSWQEEKSSPKISPDFSHQRFQISNQIPNSISPKISQTHFCRLGSPNTYTLEITLTLFDCFLINFQRNYTYTNTFNSFWIASVIYKHQRFPEWSWRSFRRNWWRSSGEVWKELFELLLLRKLSETFSTKTPPQISPSNFTTRFWVVAGPKSSAPKGSSEMVFVGRCLESRSLPQKHEEKEKTKHLENPMAGIMALKLLGLVLKRSG